MAAEMDISHSDSNGTSGDKYNAMKNFEIDKKIGKGQFSEVYRARCVVDNTIVALKKVQIFEMMDAKARQDCIKEIDLQGNVQDTVGLRLF
ncbi:NEK6 [Bugula neritina]|uniref:NEK6-subfamily protein kinase n=1 Tax=Bugula neritina TaxID=10212 RepID=A0A7J7J6C5_BUGNE|nr:NEK6 [Bugula neritina]